MDIKDLNPQSARMIYNEQNESCQLTVYENEQYRWLSFDNHQPHSAMPIRKPWQVVLPYYPVLLSSLLFQPNPGSMLMIGLGGGDLLRFYHHYLPQCRLQAVEISQLVINVFTDYFQDSNSLLNSLAIQQADVCDFLGKPDDSEFDSVYLDVYGASSLPGCFYNKNFYCNLSRLISEKGVVAVNFVVDDESDALRLMQLMYEGFEQHILCLSVGEYMNLVVLGFKQDPLTLCWEELHNGIRSLSERFEMDYNNLLINLIQNNPHMADKLRERFLE